MVVKILHAGNIAVAFGSVALAADATLTGGAGALITSALSGVEIFRKADPAQKALAKDMAAAAQDHLQAANLHGDRRKIVIQMMAIYAPDYTEMAKGNMDAPTVAANICTRIKETAKDSEHRSDTALADYGKYLTALLTPLLEPSNPVEATLQVLLRRSEVSGEAQRLRDIGITEKALIQLARRITTETDDVGQAWLELQNAMEIAVRVQAEGQIQSNHGDFVDTVLKRVAELAKDGEYTIASDEIDVALTQAEAQMGRLLDSGVEVALMDRNTAKAAVLLVRKADLDAGGVADFEMLRGLSRHYCETGRDKGSNLDSALAIELAKLVLGRAKSSDERGIAGNALGVTLRSLGERDSDTARLEQAVTANTEALKEFTREGTPMQWAMTQMNLGNALRTLGQRDSDTARLEQAVTAYTEALKEFTREGTPMQWATTQMNLGNALLSIGRRDSDTARLEQAIIAYTEALKECTRDRVPIEWAKTQSNLCSVELAFFEKTNDPTHLDRALAFMEAAQEVYFAAGATYYQSMAQQQLDEITARRDAL